MGWAWLQVRIQDRACGENFKRSLSLSLDLLVFFYLFLSIMHKTMTHAPRIHKGRVERIDAAGTRGVHGSNTQPRRLATRCDAHTATHRRTSSS